MSDTETVTISRPRQMAEDLRQAVDAGEFASRDEAVQEAVREWQERRGALDYTTDELRALVKEGLASGLSPFATLEDAKADARRRLMARLA